MKKVLITGITGFAGSYLSEFLVAKKQFSITGTYLFEESIKNISHIQEKVDLVKLDLNHKEKVEEFIKTLRPDIIFHLAALASPGDSLLHPMDTITNNIASQLHILEALRKNNLAECRFLLISSADIYGIVSKKDLPIDEETKFMPTNPYAVSKIAQDFLGLQYFLSYKLQIIRVRPFNHIGPRQSPQFVVASFAQKIAQMEKEKIAPVLKVGNLNTKRDFTDVRDMVKAYDLIVEKGKAGDVYNIGSGTSHKIGDILEKLLSFSSKNITVEIDKSLYRPVDGENLVCDNRKIGALTGWDTTISLETTLKDTLDYWRNLV